jgi:large subunit ribosomal protein L18e
MVKPKKTNENILRLVEELKTLSYERKVNIWKDVAKRLSKPSNNWAEVNVSRIARHAKKREIILVPGKLLGAGNIEVPVTVAAFHTSQSGRKKIEGAGGKVIGIEDLMKAKPDGSNVRIMG